MTKAFRKAIKENKRRYTLRKELKNPLKKIKNKKNTAADYANEREKNLKAEILAK